MSVSIGPMVWLAPIATACHFLEEWPHFAEWARDHISNRYTNEHWRQIHLLGMVSAIGFTGVVSCAPGPVSVFLFTALYLTPMLFNMIFHAATSYLYGSYSPGLLTAVVLFPAMSWYLISAFAQAGLLRAEAAAAAAVLGAVVHGIDLASTTERPPALDSPPTSRKNWDAGFRSVPGTPSSTGRACTRIASTWASGSSGMVTLRSDRSGAS
jgi:Protein of unknown function with HXXEE motif